MAASAEPSSGRARRASLFSRLWSDPSTRLGIVLAFLLLVFAVAGPWVSPWPPNETDESLLRDALGVPPGPSARHWLGVDDLHRDLLARLAYGGRVSLGVALTATGVATAVGALVGVTAGMTSGSRADFVDVVLMRVVDVLLALPFLLVVTAIAVAIGRSSVGTELLVLGLLGWTGTARLVRAKTLQLRETDYVAAARVLGAGPLRVAWTHVLPNLMGPLLVVAVGSMGQMILAEATLGYLAIGVPPPEASWGRMLHEGERYLGTRTSLIAIPGFAILVSVLVLGRLGDGLRNALAEGTRGAGPGEISPASSRRLPIDLLLAASALLLLSATSPNGVPAPTPSTSPSQQRGGHLRAATFVNVRTLDPAVAFDAASLQLIELAFARLVSLDERGHVIPSLARRATPAPDLRRFTFELREGARFHDGSEVLAHDVKRSLERLLHPKSPTPAASMYEAIRGYAPFRAGSAEHLEGVRVLGDRLLEIELERPDATFLPKMALGFAAPVCRSAGAFPDPSTESLPCGAGPFRIAAFEPDSGASFVRHDGFFEAGKPYLDTVDWRFNVPATTQRYKFEARELDMVRELSMTDASLFRAKPAWAAYGRWLDNPSTTAVFLNTELAPFDNRAIRRAVSLAFHPEILTRMRPDLVATDRLIPPSIPGPPRHVRMRHHDLGEALTEMARAGYAFNPQTGKGGYPREVEFLAIPDSADQQMAELFQQQLARIGLRVRLRLVTFAAYLAETQKRRTTQMGRAGWWADFPDPDNFFSPTLSTRAIADEHSENVAFFSNAELDALLARAQAERSELSRLDLYERAEQIVRDEAPWIPLFGSRTFELRRPELHLSASTSAFAMHLEDAWIAPAPNAGLLGRRIVP